MEDPRELVKEYYSVRAPNIMCIFGPFCAEKNIRSERLFPSACFRSVMEKLTHSIPQWFVFRPDGGFSLLWHRVAFHVTTDDRKRTACPDYHIVYTYPLPPHYFDENQYPGVVTTSLSAACETLVRYLEASGEM